MLKSLCKGACALAAVVSFSAAAQAEEHIVLIVDGSYFPSVVIAAEGDELTFKNESATAHVVTGENDAWTSGEIGAAGVFSMELTEATPASFFGTSAGSEEAVGEIIIQ